MSIRSRMIVYYSSVLVVTILVFFATAYLITLAVTGDAKSVKQFYAIHFTLKPLTPEQETLFLDLKYMAKTDPEKLFDPALQKEYDFQLRVAKSALLIRREDRVAFLSPQIADAGLEKSLPPYEMDNIRIRNLLNIGDRFYAYGKYDFALSDATRGSLFVIRELSPFAALTGKLLPLFLSILFVMLVGANVLLYLFVTRRVIRPLHKLRASAARIEEGDLDFRIEPTGSRDEIGQLILQFEHMRRKLQQSVELQLQYEANRKELLSNISHDLKTPVTTIKGYVEGIRDGVPNTPEKMDKYVETIYAKTVAMDRLIDELFLYSKLDLNKVPFELVKLDARRFVDDIVGELRFDLERHGFRIDWHGGQGEPVWVRLDPDKMKRAIANIVDNSVKFADKAEKRLSFALAADSDRVTLEIADNGPGVAPEAIRSVFDRFYRAEPSRNARTGGSGLGLAIAKQIVEGHGGEIALASTPGEGTRVAIKLNTCEA
ncbi:sensor histidine kinase [Paenibacillus flagellatus]|uniref:histidine kinase n=1 Tax=Paenibacillus flagellatus TaxID=2211139 RepID=A0A2V5KZY5_9BACL|nr:HAMP domain-containing sensor histidine kinase [Paenibacillus flagellatus]PYI55816.1 two-component sensor histidine kinase [Paenibacillus flagellatus]